MTEKYILVSDDEYCYTLDTSDKNYKTLEDFEKQEFENAKKDGIDIKDYEDAILESANDNYWNWVYNNHLEADTVNDMMNTLVDENEQLKFDKTNLHQCMSKDRVKYNQFRNKVFCCIDTKIKLLKDCHMTNEAKILEDLQKEIVDDLND